MKARRQLPLPLSASTAPSFDNFCRGANGLAVDMVQRLRAVQDTSQLYLCGPQHSGKTHLLLAAHNDCIAVGERSFYVSLKDDSLTPAVLDALDDHVLTAIDDIDQVAGQADWERALFNLINFARQKRGKIIFSAAVAPAFANWQLADLESRLGWGAVLKLASLSDAEIKQAVVMAVEKNGLEMPAETVDYLLSRHTRDVSALLDTVALLDRESLAAGRARITIPFLKSCLSANPAD